MAEPLDPLDGKVVSLADELRRQREATAPPRRFNRELARIGCDTFDSPPEPPEQIVENYLLRTVGVRVGAGGAGKSTCDLYEAVHLVLGRPLYGLEVRRPGSVLILTAEDERDIARWRLSRMVVDMRLERREIEHLAANIHIEDATRYPCRFVDVDQGGRLMRTAVLEELTEEYGKAGLAALFADPQNAFGPGERFVNDGEAELMRAGAWLAGKLNCAVRFTHHVGKGNARQGMTDQYAGRGGSAGADNARFVHVLAKHESDTDGLAAPAGATPQEIAEGRLLRLHVVKLSHGRIPAWPIWLLRRGFTFEHLKPTQADAEIIERERLRNLWQFVRDQANAGIRHTRKTIEDRVAEVGLSRAQLRSMLHIAIERRHLVEADLPESERRGGRKTCLSAGLMP